MRIQKSLATLLIASLFSISQLSGCVIRLDAPDGFFLGNRLKGSGDAASEVRIPGDSYRGVELKVPATVHVKIGPASSVELVGDDNLLQWIATDVEKGILHIESRRKHLSFSHGLEVFIETPQLESFQLAGAGEVVIDGLSESRFHAAVFGAGTLEANGVVEALEATITGSGELELQRLRTQNASAIITGSGEIDMHVEGELNYRISGSGDITYNGQALVSGSVSGSGRVSRHR